jgi:2-keto-3-deoxy-L-rhamnonate aldolase RhmA
MKSSQLRQLLRAGKTVFGTVIVSPSPRWPQAVFGSGLDFVLIDTERMALDRLLVLKKKFAEPEWKSMLNWPSDTHSYLFSFYPS